MSRSDSYLSLEDAGSSWGGPIDSSASKPGWTSNNLLNSIWQSTLARAQTRLGNAPVGTVGQSRRSNPVSAKSDLGDLLGSPVAPAIARRPAGIAGASRQGSAIPVSQARMASASAYPRKASLTRSTSGLVPSQFDPSLPTQEANAACGPAAAVAFARASGRNLSLKQAVEMAKSVGWTVSGGMNGVGNQKKLLDKMGVASALNSSGDWGWVTQNVAAGKPVTISTPGHYFVADGYDAGSGRFHVGASGTAYQNGKEWMTRQEIEGIAGTINGALVLQNPTWKA